MDDVAPRIDRDDEGRPIRVWLSAHSGEGIDALFEAMKDLLAKSIFTADIALPPQFGRLRAALFELNAVEEKGYDEQGNWLAAVRVPQIEWEKLKKEFGQNLEEFCV
jgi:GTP-binding protein HflX